MLRVELTFSLIFLRFSRIMASSVNTAVKLNMQPVIEKN